MSGAGARSASTHVHRTQPHSSAAACCSPAACRPARLPADMAICMLRPVSDESTRLIHWVEGGARLPSHARSWVLDRRAPTCTWLPPNLPAHLAPPHPTPTHSAPPLTLRCADRCATLVLAHHRRHLRRAGEAVPAQGVLWLLPRPRGQGPAGGGEGGPRVVANGRWAAGVGR